MPSSRIANQTSESIIAHLRVVIGMGEQSHEGSGSRLGFQGLLAVGDFPNAVDFLRTREGVKDR